MAHPKKILISEDVTGTGIDRLRGKYQVQYDPDLWKKIPELERMIPTYDALIVRNQTKVNASLLTQAMALRIIGRAGAGYDNIDVPAATQEGVVVAFSPEENAVSVAEHVFALLLSLARKIPGADKSTKGGGWKRKKYHGFELLGKTLGILGLGNIGFRVALRAKAFGMRILAYDAYLASTSLQVTESGAVLTPFDKVLSEADFLTVHLPLTPETRGILDGEALRKMKKTAFLINTSRGEILAEADLAQVLKQGGIAGAALDVREKEPPGESPLHGTYIGKDKTIDQLFAEGFEAVFIGVGSEIDAKMEDTPGTDLPGVFEATDFLIRGNIPMNQLPENMRQPLDDR